MSRESIKASIEIEFNDEASKEDRELWKWILTVSLNEAKRLTEHLSKYRDQFRGVYIDGPTEW